MSSKNNPKISINTSGALINGEPLYGGVEEERRGSMVIHLVDSI